MRPSLPRPLGRALLSLGLGAALVAGGGTALAAPGAAAGGEPPLVVHTEDGAVRGTLGEGYRLFQGIPFAAPPVGGGLARTASATASPPSRRDDLHVRC